MKLIFALEMQEKNGKNTHQISILVEMFVTIFYRKGVDMFLKFTSRTLKMKRDNLRFPTAEPKTKY